jgi:translation initiation factor IF-3
VIGVDGVEVGILPTREAVKLAEEQGLQLVEVDGRATPPVCRLMDLREQTAGREHAGGEVALMEIKLRAKTDEHDFAFKVKHIRRFLSQGNRCRLVIVFRGQEIASPETGVAMLDRVVEALAGAAVIEEPPVMEGRRMVMTIGPRVGGPAR